MLITSLPATVIVDGYEIEIALNGRVISKEEISSEGGNETEDKDKLGNASTISKDMYGKVVTSYKKMNQTWEIFYANETNVYLITRNCVVDPIYGSTTFNEVISNKTYREGTSMFQDSTRFPAAKEWLYDLLNSGYHSAYMNAQASIFMLDSAEVWNTSYRDPDFADWAIGGPTLELYTSSLRDGEDFCWC